MNYPAAQTCLTRALTHRDVALWLRQRGHPHAAQTAREQMRRAAKQMVDHLRPLEATRELRALGARQVARDIDSDSFKTNRPEQGAPRAASNGPSPYLRRLV